MNSVVAVNGVDCSPDVIARRESAHAEEVARLRDSQQRDHAVICALATQRDELVSALYRCAAVTGNPDPAQGCRHVIAIVRGVLPLTDLAPSGEVTR